MEPDLSLLRKSLSETDIASLFKERNIDRVLVHLMDYLNPLRQNIDRKPGSGTGYQVYKRTPGLTPNTFDDSIDLDDTEELPEKVGSYTELYLPYKTIGSRGRIYRRVQKTGKTVAELMREEIEGKAIELKDAEERRIMWGSSPTVNSKQFPGLNHYMIQNSGQVVAVASNGAGATLTLAALDEAIDKNLGNPGMIITSRTGRRKLNALLQAQQRFVDKIEIRGGFKVMSYNDIPVIASTQIPDSLDITSGGTVSALTGGSTTAFFIVDTQDVFMDVLTEVTLEMLANVSSVYREFDIFMDETLVVRDWRKVSMVSGVKAKG